MSTPLVAEHKRYERPFSLPDRNPQIRDGIIRDAIARGVMRAAGSFDLRATRAETKISSTQIGKDHKKPITEFFIARESGEEFSFDGAFLATKWRALGAALFL